MEKWKRDKPKWKRISCKKFVVTMAIIHCGLVPHQNKSINQQLISKRNGPSGQFHNETIAKPLYAISTVTK